MHRLKFIVICIVLLGVFCFSLLYRFDKNIPPSDKSFETNRILSGSFDPKKQQSNDYWRSVLTKEQYYILREAGTEIPFTGSLIHEKRIGTYYSAGCNHPVFRSEQKFDSGTGWPSFWSAMSPDAVVLREDMSEGSSRIEVLDPCGGHLGHVFDDGPNPTGKRYCINSDALIFVPDSSTPPYEK